MSSLLYISKDTLFSFKENTAMPIACEAVDQYKKTLHDLKQRKEWKTKGSGAQFMGVAHMHEPDLSHIFPTDAVRIDERHVIYSARLDDGTAIYSKSLTDAQATEAVVLRKQDFVVHDMDYDATEHRLVLSASTSHEYVRHLSVLGVEDNRVFYVTEGECLDSNPVFDPQDHQCVVYDSCGLGYDAQGNVVLGPREICQLHLKTGALETLVQDAQFNCLKPQKDAHGNLYFLKRPYKDGPVAGSSLKDILLSPFKIMKAIIGWLDFFTQRYTGESLKTSSGVNPAKAKQKSEEELFIEGNLIKVEQTLQQNMHAGEKFPGFIPSSWQLVQQTPTGEQTVIKKGVLSYALTAEGIVYSNGKYLMLLDANQQETLLQETPWVSKIIH